MTCRCPHGCSNEAAGDDGQRAVCRQCVSGWHSEICEAFTLETVNPRLAVWRFGVVALFCGRCGASKVQHAAAA